MNKREVGQQHRVRALRALARMGYATTRQVARATWLRCTPSTRRMAGRTLRWLAANGLVVSRRDGDSVNGEQLTAINARGALWLASHDKPLPGGKAHARDWLRHAHPHRTACNSVYAAMLEPGEEEDVWSELEIRAGLAPISLFKFTMKNDHEQLQEHTKIPDLICSTGGLYEWVEVEHSWRNDMHLNKVIGCMRAMFLTETQQWQHGIHRVRFVVTADGAKTIGSRLRSKLLHEHETGIAPQTLRLDARILRDHIRVSRLDPETLTLHPLPL